MAGTFVVRGSVRYYVFPDVNQCNSQNYPYYGGGPAKNADRTGGCALDPNNTYRPIKVTLCGALLINEEIPCVWLFLHTDTTSVTPDAPEAPVGKEGAGNNAPAWSKATKRLTKSAKWHKKEVDQGQGSLV